MAASRAQKRTKTQKRTTRNKQLAFLKAYRSSGSVSLAAQEAKIARRTHYNWLESDSRYRKDFEEAQSEYIDTLEREVDRRAFEGVDTPVFYQGMQVATVKRYSDRLAMFRLRALAPEKYVERSQVDVSAEVQHSGQVTLYLPDNGRDDRGS